MRILSCYIEGYGKIKGQSYVFSEGITTLFKENGGGKTTLASFIKAMFYGLKPYRKGSVEFCDREHFYPFDGGLFGGNLTFEKEGQQYKIERFFGDTSDRSDSVKVYRNGEETEELGADIGKSVFGVDRESFERTVFLGSSEVEIKSTSSIHAQLNRFLEGGDDEDFDGGFAALEKAAKVYKKSKAGNDKVSEETLRINALTTRIENLEKVRAALEGKYERAEELRLEIEALSAQTVEAQRHNERLSQYEHYDSLAEQISRAEEELSALLARYPFGVPTDAETANVESLLAKEREEKLLLENGEFSTVEKEKLSRLEEGFQGGFPTETELLAVERKIESYAKLETEGEILEGSVEGERENRVLQKFPHGAPTEERLSKIEEDLEAYRRIQKSLSQAPVTAQREAGGGRAYTVWAVICAALLLFGGGALLVNTLLGGGLLAVGLVGLLVDGFLYLNGKSSLASVQNPERVRLELALREAEENLKAVLLPYGYRSEHGVAFDVASLQTDAHEYARIVEERRSRREKLTRNEGQKGEIEEELTAFFRGVGLSGAPYAKLLSDLRIRIRECQSLQAREKSCKEYVAEHGEKLRKIQAEIEGFQRKYGLRELHCAALLEDIRTAARLQKQIEEDEGKAAAYSKEKGLGARTEEARVDLESLQARVTALQEERGKLRVEIGSDERDVESLESYESEKADAEVRLKGYKRKHKLLTAAAELLQKADGQLRERYVEPVKKEFLRHADVIERALGEKVIVTKDFELRFERSGKERSEKHLSAGQRSVCGLCFRLALVKNMYREELPFLVLDDPFAALDEEHFEKVAQVLRELSKEMQMLYFTCHSSRKL